MQFDKNELWGLSQGELKELSKQISFVKEHKFKRRNSVKYRVPGYKTFQTQDFDLFLSNIKPHEYQFKVLFLVDAFLGLREGELVKLKISDFDFRNKTVKIRTEKQRGYFDVQDIMPLNKKLEELLIEYLSEYEEDINKHEGFLFYAKSNACKTKHLSTAYLRKFFRVVCARAGLTETYSHREPSTQNSSPQSCAPLYKYSPHSIRHAFGNYLCTRGVPPIIAKHLLRHKSLKATEVYYVPQASDVLRENARVFT